MNTDLTFLDCPAYMDEQGTARCGLPASVEYRYTVMSTGGPLESAKIRCPRGHFLDGPIEFLTWGKHPADSAVRRSIGLP
jgi:hypothetical protein